MQPDGNIILHYHCLKPSLEKDTCNQVSVDDKDDVCNNCISASLSDPRMADGSGRKQERN